MRTTPNTGAPPVPLKDDDAKIQILKSQYLQCLASLEISLPNLRQIVRRLLAVPVPWKLLVKWAAQAGYRNKYLRKILSEILVDAGIRRRKPGAGRETPPEALALLASLRQQHGEARAEKLLLAAYRASKSQRRTQRQHERATLKIIPVGQAFRPTGSGDFPVAAHDDARELIAAAI
jgi:hypothetical protein